MIEWRDPAGGWRDMPMWRRVLMLVAWLALVAGILGAAIMLIYYLILSLGVVM
jgi:hypothetical protein